MCHRQLIHKVIINLSLSDFPTHMHQCAKKGFYKSTIPRLNNYDLMTIY